MAAVGYHINVGGFEEVQPYVAVARVAVIGLCASAADVEDRLPRPPLSNLRR